ncbi:methyltransferase domain-containing protein [Pedobacter sp. MR22-3]|uniref:methyltransferase domain-containing protein n=1 Tax=Pedobacter sp. MR22-3 TaxID=2994552 RepID=UPI00224765B7|nr:class I SAM-dependent methyltransferase [Pedobacter sp. MR22-3]MCX2583523.1 class I SAM-dependent methyltransferase [Pedobacter sp. MR22-3]
MELTTQQRNESISNATNALLFEDDYLHIKNAIDQLHLLFAGVTGVNAGNITDQDIHLPSGKAVSTIKAAHCLMEIDRTRKFLRGIHQAINHILDKRPNQTINILYAGCGPYATLLTPLTTIFTAQQVRFTMLDVNAASLDAARLLYKELGILDYVTDFVCTDATHYQLSANGSIDMIISETMLNALRKEPQLAIMNNLVPQLNPDAIFIPEHITVEAVLTRWEEEYKYFITPDYQPKRIKAGLVYRADRKFQLPKPVVIHAPASETHNRLDLFTEINVFGGEMLKTYNCSLTMPLAVCKLENQNEDIAVTFEYVMSDNPGFTCTF